MANDWIKLYRKLKDSPIWQHLNSRQRDVYINILLMANHKEKEWFDGREMVKIAPGEFITSLPSLKKHCAKEVTIQNIRTCLLILSKAEFLTCTSTNRWRRIRVLNWAKYQGKDCELTDTPTGNQQATNRQLTANKNEKNDKNEKNNIPFEKFWELYDKKVGRPKAEQKWNKLKLEEQQAILEYIPKYKISQPNKTYRKNPETFFNNRSWEDELVSDDKGENKGMWKCDYGHMHKKGEECGHAQEKIYQNKTSEFAQSLANRFQIK